MKQVADWISRVGKQLDPWQLPGDKEARLKVLKEFHTSLKTDTFYQEIKKEVKEVCKKFPIPVLC